MAKDEFLANMYDPILEKLNDKENPIDVRKLDIARLGVGRFISATRVHRGARTKALGETANYEYMGTEEAGKEADKFGYGLIALTTHEYKLNSGTEIERDIARALLLRATPKAKDNPRLLQTPIAVQILGTQAFRYLAGKTEKQADENYDAMKLIANGKAPTEVPNGERALAYFTDLMDKIQTAQIKSEV